MVTLLTRLPFEQGNPPGVTWLEPERVLTGRLHRPGMEPVLLANLYGHQDRDERAKLILEVVGAFHSTGLPWIVLGDFNEQDS